MASTTPIVDASMTSASGRASSPDATSESSEASSAIIPGTVGEDLPREQVPPFERYRHPVDRLGEGAVLATTARLELGVVAVIGVGVQRVVERLLGRRRSGGDRRG